MVCMAHSYELTVGDLLTALGTPHKIVTRGQQEKSDKGDGHRINVLAAARNAALEPLYSGDAEKFVHGGLFHEMLFMNDIHFCAVDILEVLYQKRSQRANQACAMDWGREVVYDRWIIRTMTGRFVLSSF
jgi:alpha-1,3-mannosyltransferase